jgi:hypothetical protein
MQEVRHDVSGMVAKLRSRSQVVHACERIEGTAIRPLARLLEDAADTLKDEVERRARLEWVLAQIVRDLPANLNWLDPVVEREARDLVAFADTRGGTGVR